MSSLTRTTSQVGKTLLTTALLRSTAALYQHEEQTSQNGSQKKVFYLKPVSTGSADEADDRYVQELCSSSGSDSLSLMQLCQAEHRRRKAFMGGEDHHEMSVPVSRTRLSSSCSKTCAGIGELSSLFLLSTS